jgi:hypothetical protein
VSVDARTPRDAETWNEARKYMSHHLLKNVAVLDITRIQRLASGQVADDALGPKAVKGRLREVRHSLLATRRLLSECVQSTTPIRLVDQSAFSFLDTESRIWLCNFLHMRWQKSNQVTTRLRQARAALREARRSLRALETQLSRVQFKLPDASVAMQANDLAARLGSLANTLSLLPRGPFPC